MMQSGNSMPPMNRMAPMNPMAQMNPGPFTSTIPHPWLPMLPPAPPPSSAFWETTNVSDRLKELNETIELAKSMEKELEALIRIKDGKGSMEGVDDGSMLRLSRFLEENRIDLVSQESLSLRAANDIMSKLGAQLEPFRVVTNETSPWEEKSAAVRLANKMQKSRRNKQWRKRKRRIAEMLVKEREQFDQADQEADEWRAREIAKDIAKRKVSKSSTCDSFEAPQDEASIVENDATLEDMERTKNSDNDSDFRISDEQYQSRI